MAYIPTILEPGRADGKLIKINSVYDDDNEIFLSDRLKNIDNTIINLADNEDLTNINNVLKLADKDYNQNSYSGLGRKYLRKNIVSGINTLTQSMINQPNTIYIIQYDFTLSEDITIPANCILDFEGGSLSGNATIIGNNTVIKSKLIKIFDTRIILDGNWNVTEAYPEWFGAKGDSSDYDNSSAINACINNTPFRKVVLKNGGVYVIYSSIILKSKNFYFGSNSNVNEYNSFDEKPVGAKLLSRADIIAVKVPEKAFEIEIHGLTIYQGWANRFTGVGIEFAEDKSINSCKFFGLKICYFNVGFRAIFRDSYSGISLCRFADCSFIACLVGMFLYYYDFTIRDKKWWMNLNHFDNCHWSHNAYGGLNISGVYSFEQNLFTACGFESNGRNLNSEGWPEYTGNKDIYGVRIKSNKGYGLSTFDNCYFEINLAKGTSNTQTYEETNGNENVTAIQSDVQLSGAQCQFRQCTFNYGITPIICFGNTPVKLTIDNCDFKNLVGEAIYKGDCIILIRKANLASDGYKNYITINQGFLDAKWLNKPIGTLNVTGLTFMSILINTPGFCAAKSPQAFDTRKRRYQSIKVDDEFIKIIDYPLFGNTDQRPIIDIGGNSSIYGFQYFDRTLGKPIYWNGSSWIDATGTPV